MTSRTIVPDLTVEFFGGLVILLALSHVALDADLVLVDAIEVGLPIVAGAVIVGFGYWLRTVPEWINVRGRLIAIFGCLAGGVLSGLATGWILFVVSLENPLPAEIRYIYLNGMSIGLLLGLVLATAYLYLTRQRSLLGRQTDRLSSQENLLDNLASILAHDLRNPLSVASGRLELAMNDYDDENLRAVDRALERMYTLLDDLLVLARQGLAVREHEATSLPDLVDQAWDSVRTYQAELVLDTAQVIMADRTRVQQLLENLIRNAIDHGGETVTITVGDLEDGFYVEDDGPGIDPAKRAQVFEAGYTTKPEGTGLGLLIVKEIAEAHGWSVRVTDGSSGGARFEITDVVEE